MFNAINAPSYHGTQVSSLYRHFEWEKQQKYEQRIREIKMGSFTPLVFSTLRGGMGHVLLYFTEDLLSLSLFRSCHIVHGCIAGLVVLCYAPLLGV